MQMIHGAPEVTVNRDTALGVATAVAAVGALLTESAEHFSPDTRDPGLLACSLVLVPGGAAAFYRSRPVLAALVTVAAYTLASGLGYATFVTSLIVAVVLGLCAGHADRRSTIVLGATSTALAVVRLIWEADTWPVTVTGVVAAIAFAIIPVAVGDAFRSRLDLTREALERAVSDERLRIAREVHDIVGHHLSSVAIQVGAGEQWIRVGEPDRAASVLRTARSLASVALGETQEAIQLIRNGGHGGPLQVARRLGALDELADRTRASGVHVTIRREGAQGSLPTLVDTCAFRIVQEALTNVVRHAAARNVSITVRRLDGRLELAIVDDGRGGSRVEGHGLAGMHERATLSGGTLTAGPTVSGWRVDATLPLIDSPAA